jgi:hypothetical protein
MDESSENPRANPKDEPGKVTRVRGSLVDVEFASGRLPAIKDAITIAPDSRNQLIAEVQVHLDVPASIARLSARPIRGARRAARALRATARTFHSGVFWSAALVFLGAALGFWAVWKRMISE